MVEATGAIPLSAWAQYGIVILIMGFVIIASRELVKVVKLALDEFAKYREEQKAEMVIQRTWSEEQGEKRDKFQKELTTSTMNFISDLQKDQAKSSEVLNQSITLLSIKTDQVLNAINNHHNFVDKSINEIDKWRNGIQINRKDSE